jgi:hypothetical protein
MSAFVASVLDEGTLIIEGASMPLTKPALRKMFKSFGGGFAGCPPLEYEIKIRAFTTSRVEIRDLRFRV